MIDDADYQRTFVALQRTEPGKFHQLGDDILREISDDFLGLKPHGLNAEGKSKPGVPDSFVGNSAEECVVAVEYSTLAENTEGKARADYHSILARCQNVRVICLCTSRTLDRPKLADIAQESKARGIRLHLVDGKQIAKLLVGARQDLRLRYLGIPIMSLTMTSLRFQLQTQLQTFSNTHVDTQAVETLYPRPHAERELSGRVRKRGLSILSAPLGTGKTTWSFDHARRRSALSPSIWFPAAELALGATDPIGEMVSHIAYGVTACERLLELSGIMIQSELPLLVCIDGIDEVQDYQEFMRAVSLFRRGALGVRAHILLTCREDALSFLNVQEWPLRLRLSAEESEFSLIRMDELSAGDSGDFLRTLGATPLESHRVLRIVGHSHGMSPLFLRHGLALVRRGANLVEDELITAVSRAYVRDISRRLRVSGCSPSEASTAASLARIALRAAENPRESLTRRCLSELNDPALSIDGENSVIGRAVQSGLLRDNGEVLRFAHVSFIDWFAVEAIRRDPSWEAALQQLPRARRAAILPRLASESTDSARILTFASELDPATYCTVASKAWKTLPDSQRKSVLASMLKLLSSQFTYDKRQAIAALARLEVHEAGELLWSWLQGLPSAERSSWAIEASYALMHLEVPEAVSVILLNVHFMMAGDGWFEPTFVNELRRLSPRFSAALSNQAWNDLQSATEELARLELVAALAMLKDERLIVYLEQRSASCLLTHAEIRSLILFDTNPAIRVFEAACKRILEEIDQLTSSAEDVRMKRAALLDRIAPNATCVSMFPCEHLVQLLNKQLSGANNPHMSLWLNWSTAVGDERLTVAWAEAAYPESIQNRIWHGDPADLFRKFGLRNLVNSFPAGSAALRRAIVTNAKMFAGPDIEQLLVRALDDDDLRNQAIYTLGYLGVARAGQLLIGRLGTDDEFLLRNVIQTLGRLRDTSAVASLKEILDEIQSRPLSARTNKDCNIEYVTIEALGVIGGDAAFDVLARSFEKCASPDQVLGHLLRRSDSAGIRICEQLLAGNRGARRYLISGLTYRELGGTYPKPDLPYIESASLLEILLEACLEAPLTSPSVERSYIAALARFREHSAMKRIEDVAMCSPPDVQPRQFDLVAQARRVLALRGHATYAPMVIREVVARAVRGGIVTEWSLRELEPWSPAMVKEALLEHVARREKAVQAILLLHALSEDDERPLLESLLTDEDEELRDTAYQLSMGYNPLVWM